MKKIILRSLSIILLLMICIGMCSITASAYDVGEKIRSGEFDYYLQDDGTIRLDAYYGGDEYFEVPEVIDGHEVSIIGRYGAQWFFNMPVDGVFKHLKTKSIKLPKSIVGFAYNNAASCFGNWSTIENIYVDEENLNFESDNGIFYDKDITKLLFYPEGKEDLEFKVPDSVDTIEYSSISSNKYLKKVYLSKQISFIDDYSFSNCPNVNLYVYDNSYGLEWAKSHDFPYVIMEEPPVEKELVDENTGIQVSGVMDAEATLNVESVENTVENAISSFNITLVKDGNIIQPDGSITISIPSEYSDCDVFWIKDDGTKVNMNAEYVDAKYVFTTDHLSIYALVRNNVPTVPEPTETIPIPTETDPVPTETVPEPTETDPVPTETLPEPTVTDPVPTETVPVTTGTDPINTEPPTTEPTTTAPVVTPDTPSNGNNGSNGSSSNTPSSNSNNTSNGAVATGDMFGIDNSILIALILAATTAMVIANKRRKYSSK